MSTDLDQLPIPDWGLHCPQCNYPLVGLPGHRCPECGTKFNLREVVQPWDRLRDPWFDGTELPLPEWGLSCGSCGASLTGINTYKCSHCGEVVPQPLRWVPQRDWFVVNEDIRGPLVVSFCETLMQAYEIPHRRDYPPIKVNLDQGAEPLLLVRREFYFDVRHVLAQERIRMAEDHQLAEGAPLKCSNCNAESPGNFTLCWNCGHKLT